MARTLGKTLEEVPTLTSHALLDRIADAPFLIFKMDIEGAEKQLLSPGALWLERTNVLMVELHDRFIERCKTAFMQASRPRCAVSTGGEKFL